MCVFRIKFKQNDIYIIYKWMYIDLSVILIVICKLINIIVKM